MSASNPPSWLTPSLCVKTPHTISPALPHTAGFLLEWTLMSASNRHSWLTPSLCVRTPHTISPALPHTAGFLLEWTLMSASNRHSWLTLSLCVKTPHTISPALPHTTTPGLNHHRSNLPTATVSLFYDQYCWYIMTVFLYL